VAAIISCSVGSCEPGGNLPLVMSAMSRVTSSPVSERGAGNGLFTESLRVAALSTLTPCEAKSSYDMTSA
jgi:hypothetical protein